MKWANNFIGRYSFYEMENDMSRGDNIGPMYVL